MDVALGKHLDVLVDRSSTVMLKTVVAAGAVGDVGGGIAERSLEAIFHTAQTEEPVFGD